MFYGAFYSKAALLTFIILYSGEATDCHAFIHSDQVSANLGLHTNQVLVRVIPLRCLDKSGLADRPDIDRCCCRWTERRMMLWSTAEEEEKDDATGMSNIATVAAAVAAVVVVDIASVVVAAVVVAVVLLESACCNRCSNAFLKPRQLLLQLLLLRPVLIYCLETNYFQRSFFLPPCSPLLLIYFLYIQMLLKRFVIVA